MKIWLISQTENDNYDTYDSAVVTAESEEQAKETQPGGKEEWAAGYRTWASSAKEVTAELIGEAIDGTEAGVICSSFNAG